MDFLIENPLLLAGVLIVLVGALVAVKLLRKRDAKVDAGFIPGMDDLLKQGNYAQAALLAQRHGRYEQAIEYYLRAQDPLRAAHVAAKTDNARRAAELYERAGAFDSAAEKYVEAGMPDKAKELRAAKAQKTTDDSLGGPAPHDAAPQSSEHPERRFRKVLAEARDDVEGKTKLQEAGAEAAEELLRQGDIRRAAEVYKEAGLIDEAVHLYVNVLGAPGEAAPLVAARGNHERAAELFELAGKLERAAALWVDIARVSSQPEGYIDRIESLSEDAVRAFLEELTRARPLADKSVELHYRLARVLERQGEAARALTIYEQVHDRIGEYKDVKDRVGTLRSAGSVVAKPERAPNVKVGDDFPPPPPLSDLSGIAPGGSHRTERAGVPGPEGTMRSQEPGPVNITTEQVSAIAKEAVNAALEQATRGGLFTPLALDPGPNSSRVKAELRGHAPQILVVGLEQKKIAIDDLADSATLAARDGPSIESLREFIADRPCDLQNIEVYYRLGLAYVGNGKWAEAMEAFDAVEEASPGYRDAEKRADRIRDWQRALGNRMSLVTRGASSKTEASRYQVHGELGRGGMAVVYRATDEVLGREVALKFLAEELTSHKEMRDMFQREARSVAQLNHPNIVTIFDYGVLDGKAFICMEFIEGTSVESYIDQRGKLPVIESLRIAEQILDALGYAHSRNIIHRDIKPSNMMRSKSGIVKLMDFGLAKSVAGGAQASIIAGTPAYMPPEQAEGGEVDHRADLFSVGCSLYEMLTGQLPFKGVDRSAPPPELREHDDKLPGALQDVISRALAFDPARRYQSAKEFAAPIRHITDAVDKFTSSFVNTPKSPRTPEYEKATAPSGPIK